MAGSLSPSELEVLLSGLSTEPAWRGAMRRPDGPGSADWDRYERFVQAAAARLGSDIKELFDEPVRIRAAIHRDDASDRAWMTVESRLMAVVGTACGPKRCLVSMDRRLIYAVIQRLTGTSTDPAQAISSDCSLTEIERRAAVPLINRLTSPLLGEALANSSLRFTEIELSPDEAQRHLTEERMLRIDVEVCRHAAVDGFALRIPDAEFEQIEVAGCVAEDGRPLAASRVYAVGQQNSPPVLEVVVGRTALSADDLAGLEPGDLIRTTIPAGQPAEVRQTDQTLFRGRIRLEAGRKAVRISEVVREMPVSAESIGTRPVRVVSEA